MRTHRVRHAYTSPLTAAASLVLALVAGSAGCGGERAEPPADVTLVLAAYSTPREVMEGHILPAFAADWHAKTGKTLRVEASYLASGAQTRAVLGGFAADVVLLAMAPDVDKLANAGLVAKSWADGPERGIVTSSVVAFAVRTGNPKGITRWADLARPGVGVLMPNPKTSGGAMWNVSALWGAALRGEAGFPAGDQEAAHDYLRAVLRNVAVLDKGGRESVITFEKGVGDVAITYETEIVAAPPRGPNVRRRDPEGHPPHRDPRGRRRDERRGPRRHQGGRSLRHLPPLRDRAAGLRAPRLPRAGRRAGGGRVRRGAGGPQAPATAAPPILFRISDLGGWKSVVPTLFGPEGAFTKTWERVLRRVSAQGRAAPPRPDQKPAFTIGEHGQKTARASRCSASPICTPRSSIRPVHHADLHALHLAAGVRFTDARSARLRSRRRRSSRRRSARRPRSLGQVASPDLHPGRVIGVAQRPDLKAPAARRFTPFSAADLRARVLAPVEVHHADLRRSPEKLSST
jgi:ABC-type sulfate transport system substrate-binding protein